MSRPGGRLYSRNMKHSSGIVFLGCLLTAFGVFAEEAGKPTNVTLRVYMIEKSVIRARPATNSLCVTISAGQATIPFSALDRVTFDEKKPGFAKIRFANGDVLSAKVNPGSLRCDTLLGTISVPVENVRSIEVHVVRPPPPPLPVPEVTDAIVAARKKAPLLWWGETGAPIHSSPAVAHLNNDEVPDCVVATLINEHKKGRDVVAFSGRDGKELWQFSPGGGMYCSPGLGDITGDGTPDVAVGSWNRNVVAGDGKTGHILWRFRTEQFVESCPAFADLNGDKVPDCVFGSHDGNVYALPGMPEGAGTGRYITETLWVHEIGDKVKADPAITNLTDDAVPDVIAAATDGSVTALSGTDGSRIWRADLPGAIGCARIVAADIDSDRQPEVVVPYTGGIAAFRAKDGTEIWRFHAGDIVDTTPALADLNGDGTADCVGATILGEAFAVDGKTGRLFWRMRGGSKHSGVALVDCSDDSVPDCVMGDKEGGIVVLCGITGKRIWSHKTEGIVGNSTPAIADLTGDGLPECICAYKNGLVHAIRLPGRAAHPRHSIFWQRAYKYKPVPAEEREKRRAAWAAAK